MMKIMRQWTAALLCALLALTPVLSFAEGDYDAGELTGTVASVAYQYGQQINLKVHFDGVPSGDSKRAKAISNLLSESELALSFYDDYGTGRIHGVFSLDGMDLLEGTLLLPADGSMQLKTNLTGSTMLTFPAGTLGKSMNWQDVFYGSIVRVYGNVGRDELYRQLTRILHHEVRHHNEYLAGTDDLGLWDDDQILDYLKKNGVKPKK